MTFAIISLFIVLFISILITRLAALALTLTGMSQEAARFQARSALAGVGFTTKEAETVVNHPVRRRIIMWLMLTGSVGIPTVIATTIVSVLSSAQTPRWWLPVLLFVIGVTALTSFGRSRWIEKNSTKFLPGV